MATGRYLLIAFSSKIKIQISNWISVSKAGSAGVNRSVSCLWSPLAPDLRSCPCIAAALSGSPAFYAGSWHGIQIQTADAVFKVRSGYEELQAGRPSANSLGI